MAIAFTKYVDIVSGVAGAAQAVARELMGRLFTTNPLTPTKSFAEFSGSAAVGVYFGTDSQEYLRSLFYFGWVSKITTSPRTISFARWADEDTAPLIFGETGTYAIGDFSSISDASMALTLGPDTEIVVSDFTGDASLADVAATLQVDIRAANIAAVWATATVVYNAVTSRFELTGGAVGNNVVVVADAGSGTEVAGLIGWLNTGTILSNGVVEESITTVLAESAAASNNFGSFLFMAALTDAEILEASVWNAGQNVLYQFFQSVLEADAQATYDAVKDNGGTGIMIQSPTAVNEYPEMMPMNILAATDYNRRNANQNYMFQQFSISATVSDTTVSDNLDAIRMNYYGETQQAGASLRFFQRGQLMGLAADPLAMNVFANEQWLKDANSVSIMNLLLAVNAVAANDSGTAQVLGVIQPNITQAQLNGTIQAGKELTAVQQSVITSITGDENAWRQVQAIGYWITAIVEEPAPDEFVISYILIYAKGDTVRKVEGVHTLI